KYPGKYMFHAHKTEFAEKGWTGLFLVKDGTTQSVNENLNVTSIRNITDYSTSDFNRSTNHVPTGGVK
ncbi:MAG: hypothetical protein ACRD93_02700, partial [Nitrososphaeraceae archaeon]